MNQNKVEMRLLDINERITTFKEVSLGYNHDEAINEANRCLNCKNPSCVKGCPVNVNIPKFIELLKNDKLDESLDEILKENPLPSICGRVCPQEKQCEKNCIRGIKGDPVRIGNLERYVSDNAIKNNHPINKNGMSVAIVGSGPSGLTCANICLDLGYDVTIFEALHEVGGVLVYGIPEFRLPKSIVKKEVDDIISKGGVIKTNYVVGKTVLLEELIEEFDAIFIGVGAGLPRFMGIKGEELNNVVSANEFLTRVNLMKANMNYDTCLNDYKNVVVVGGGNVAMDAARVSRRLGCNVTICYRRSIDDMPARHEEIVHAMEEGIKFMPLCNPFEITGDDLNNCKSIKLNKMGQGDVDASGRRSFYVIDGSEFSIDCDLVIMALGNMSNPILKNSTSAIKFNDKGLIITDNNYKTTSEKVYAGGDIVTGGATVIMASSAGKTAALEIDKMLKNSKK